MHEIRCFKSVAVMVVALCSVAGARAGGAELTFKDRIPDLSDPWPTWIEGDNGAVLMAYGQQLGGDGRMRVAESTDGGRTWTIISYLNYKTDYAYMSRLRDGRLVMVVYNDCWEPETTQDLGWVSSTDGGRTWSEINRIPVDIPHVYPYGPIIEMPDGRWAYCPYTAELAHYLHGPLLEIDAFLIWSDDQGRSWSKPIGFGDAADGNRGMAETTIAQVSPSEYVAAIRADILPKTQSEESLRGWDGFYLSRSPNGSSWSVPKSLADMGRMPLIYRIEPWWVLTYRQYVPAEEIQYSVYRVSKDGLIWSEPHRIERGVNNAPFLVRVGDELIAFNHEFPDRARLTRNVVKLPAIQ